MVKVIKEKTNVIMLFVSRYVVVVIHIFQLSGMYIIFKLSIICGMYSVVVEVVLVDQSNKPIDSKDSIKTIESSSAGSDLSKQGITLATVQPETAENRPVTNNSSKR